MFALYLYSVNFETRPTVVKTQLGLGGLFLIQSFYLFQCLAQLCSPLEPHEGW